MVFIPIPTLLFIILKQASIKIHYHLPLKPSSVTNTQR